MKVIIGIMAWLTLGFGAVRGTTAVYPNAFRVSNETAACQYRENNAVFATFGMVFWPITVLATLANVAVDGAS